MPPSPAPPRSLLRSAAQVVAVLFSAIVHIDFAISPEENTRSVTVRTVSLAILLAIGALLVGGCGGGGAGGDEIGASQDPSRWTGAIEGQSTPEQLGEDHWLCHPVDPAADTWYGCLVPAPAPADATDPKYADFDGIRCVPPAGRVRQVEGGVQLQLAPVCAGLAFERGVRLPPNQIVWQIELTLPPAAQALDVVQDLGTVVGATWTMRDLGSFHSDLDPEQPCPVDVVVGTNTEGDEMVSCPASDIWTFSDLTTADSQPVGAPSLRLSALGTLPGERVSLVLGSKICAYWAPAPAWADDAASQPGCVEYEATPALDSRVGSNGELLDGVTGVAARSTFEP